MEGKKKRSCEGAWEKGPEGVRVRKLVEEDESFALRGA